MTQGKSGRDINLGEYLRIQEVSCLAPFPFSMFLVPDSRLRFFPICAFPFSTPSFLPTHASLFLDSRRFFSTHASPFPDSRLPFFLTHASFSRLMPLFPDSRLFFFPTHASQNQSFEAEDIQADHLDVPATCQAPELTGSEKARPLCWQD